MENNTTQSKRGYAFVILISLLALAGVAAKAFASGVAVAFGSLTIGMLVAQMFLAFVVLWYLTPALARKENPIKHPYGAIGIAAAALALGLFRSPKRLSEITRWEIGANIENILLFAANATFLVFLVSILTGIELMRNPNEPRQVCAVASAASPIPVFILLVLGATGWNG